MRADVDEEAEAQLRVLGYARVSTDEQALSGAGIDGQRDALKRAAEYEGWTLLDIAVDEGASGKDLNRPGLYHALERIAAGEADGLVVAKLDRLSRSTVDFGEILEWMSAANARFVALDFRLDTTTAAGMLVANVLMSVAEWERRAIADRTKVALAAKRARGEVTGRPAITDHPELRERIQELHAAGNTLSQIARILTAEGVPTVRGGARWGPSSLQVVIGYKRPPARRRRAELPDIPRRRRRTP